MGATQMNEQPWISGRRAPNFHQPSVCSRVAKPDVNRSALISAITCPAVKLQRAAQNQRHRHRARVHHQHMLQPEQEQLRKPLDLIDRVASCHGRSPWQRRVARAHAYLWVG